MTNCFDKTVNVYMKDENGVEQEIECNVFGGFFPETWGYNGGSPEEFPEVEIIDAKGVSEDLITEEVLRMLRAEYDGRYSYDDHLYDYDDSIYMDEPDYDDPYEGF